MASQEQPTTVAFLGAGTLAEDILMQLLRDEGYSIRFLEGYPTGPIDELLEDVDVLLLTPGLDKGVREAFLGAMSRNPKTATVPLLTIPPELKEALLDQEAVSASWQSLFEVLVGEIESALWSVGAAEGPLVEAEEV